jgi:hypothetical protein
MKPSRTTHDAPTRFQGTLTKVLLVQVAALAVLGALQLLYTR